MKYDVSNKISETVADYSVSHRQIARAAGVSHSTISRASKAGYMVTKPVRDAIGAGCNKLSMHTPTAVIAANLEKQVEQLRETIGQTPRLDIGNLKPEFQKIKPFSWSRNVIAQTSSLVDDAIESAHSREKAELQKALAARISEVQNLAADVAYEREKGLSTLNQLLRAEDMLKDERVKNKTQAESIGQCLDEIDRLKRLVALRTQDLAVYQKELEEADNRADDAEYKASELERDLSVQRAWTWLFVLLAFVAATVGVVK